MKSHVQNMARVNTMKNVFRQGASRTRTFADKEEGGIKFLKMLCTHYVYGLIIVPSPQLKLKISL